VLRIIRILAPNPGVRELEGTNTYVVGDAPAALVIDPGPDDERHLAEVARTAGRVGAIVLTHDHPDHAPGATRLAEMTGAPVRAMRLPAGGDRLRGGEVVASDGVALQVVPTPGHSPDHAAFWSEEEGALFTGDAVLGRGTSVIDPPEGDLVAYLRSLRRMRELAPRTIYPGHGPIVLDGTAKLEEYFEHRAMRERQLLEALEDGGTTIDELVSRIYAEYPKDVLELAARSVLAHLLKLDAEGRIEKSSKGGDARYTKIEPRTCARCGRPVRGKARYCGACSLAMLQGTD
jgi:glyoxylase-like metal-dependent hydrolase (beta-lactamase superfamily II)